jgi:hypothetical protein
MSIRRIEPVVAPVVVRPPQTRIPEPNANATARLRGDGSRTSDDATRNPGTPVATGVATGAVTGAADAVGGATALAVGVDGELAGADGMAGAIDRAEGGAGVGEPSCGPCPHPASAIDTASATDGKTRRWTTVDL